MKLNGMDMAPETHAKHWYEVAMHYRSAYLRVSAREAGDEDWVNAPRRAPPMETLAGLLCRERVLAYYLDHPA